MAEEEDEEREDFLKEFKDKAAKDQFGNSAVSGDHENKQQVQKKEEKDEKKDESAVDDLKKPDDDDLS